MMLADKDVQDFNKIEWVVSIDQAGLRYREVKKCYLFGAEQTISIMEVDPSVCRIEFVQEEHKQTPRKIGKDNNAIAAINGSFYKVHSRKAIVSGVLKINDTIQPSLNYDYFLDAVVVEDKNVSIVSCKTQDELIDNYKNVMTNAPLLVSNGEQLLQNDVLPYARTLVATRLTDKGNQVLFIVVEGFSKKRGMTFDQCGKLALLLGCNNCLNLDGGGSSAMWVKNKGVINKPSDRWALMFSWLRKVANCIIIKY